MIEIVNKIVNFYKCGFNINNNKYRIEDYQYIQNIRQLIPYLKFICHEIKDTSIPKYEWYDKYKKIIL